MTNAKFLVLLIFLALVVFSAFIFISPDKMVASLFFKHDLTPEILGQKFAGGGKVRILIVPGHDEENYGARLGNITEAEMVLKIGKYLRDYFQKDNRFEIALARDDSGYYPLVQSYLDNSQDIFLFVSKARSWFNDLIKSKVVKRNLPPLEHVNVNTRTFLKLYGINKWANDNAMEIVLHLHLNDSPTKREYSGFSIYIPEKQLPNYAVSRPIAESLAEVFNLHWLPSDLPMEKDVVIEDQDLIAVGALGTLRSAGLLIEYGYITEPRFGFDEFLKEAAFHTYAGIVSYFTKKNPADGYEWIFPYSWQKDLSFGAKNDLDTAVLQLALKKLGFYPPEGRSLRECPITGNFKNCTREALGNFQKENMIESVSGYFGSDTIKLMNLLFNN